MRCDGIYVSRNTYFRLGAVQWDVKNPVHLVVYYRWAPPACSYSGSHTRPVSLSPSLSPSLTRSLILAAVL